MKKVYDYQLVLPDPVGYDEDLITHLLSELLDEERYGHVMRVLDTAKDLSEKFQCSDKEKQKIIKAVLFHDLAKGMTEKALREYAHSYRISLTGVQPPIYHAVVGEWMAQYFFDVHDQEILDAIRYHTTGSAKFMTNRIGAILFLADYLEPGRELDCSHIEEHIPSNMIFSLREVAKDKIVSVIQRDRVLDQESIDFYHALIQ